MRILTIVLAFLISQKLFAVTIDVTGTGNDQKWELKALPQTTSLIVNYDDETDQVDFVSNQNTAQELTNPFETTGDDGNPHVTTNDDGTSNNFLNTNDSETLYSVFEDEERTPNLGSSTIDTDDDVPTLLSIRSRIHSLQQELTKQATDTRGTTGVVTNFETKETQSKEVELADLYNVMRQVIPDNQEAIQDIENEENEKDSALAQLGDQFEELTDEITEKINKIEVKPSEPTSSFLDTRFELDIGSRSFYLDPFNDLYTGGLNVGFTWQDLADWISLITGLLAVFIYFNAVRRNFVEVLRTLTLAPLTAPVSNVSIFGNSLGTIGLIALKIATMLTIFGSSTFFSVLVLLESNFTIGGTTTSILNIVGNITPYLTGTTGIMSDAVALLFDLIPIISISLMFTAFLSAKMLGWIILTFGISLSKAQS